MLSQETLDYASMRRWAKELGVTEKFEEVLAARS
jgi:hypothetical protein